MGGFDYSLQAKSINYFTMTRFFANLRDVKKVLVITYYWPPGGGAGVQRWLKFVKYLREYGWEPVVYTPENGEQPVLDMSLSKDIPSGLQVIKSKIWEPYRIYKWFSGKKQNEKINASFLTESKKPGLAEKISVWIRGNFFIPDARSFWIKPSIRFLLPILKKEQISHIISTGPPHSMHLIAMGLKRELPQLKWLADFRDPWTNIDFYDKLMLSTFADRKHRRLEREVLLNSDAVLSIGQTMSAELEKIYRQAGGQAASKFHVLPNGYDDADLSRGSVEKDPLFTIAHIGTLVSDRNPAVLWKVLKKLLKNDPAFSAKLRIKLVGKVDVRVKEDLERHGLASYVDYVAYLPHDEVVLEQQRARVLLLLVNHTPNAKGILTGKFFEYMASGSPILAIGPVDGELADILNRTRSGRISGFEDEAGLEKNILAYYHHPVSEAIETEVKKFSRRALTARLAELLSQL